jgi:hypothetical protein
VNEWLTQALIRLSWEDYACVLVALIGIRLGRYAGMWLYALIVLPGTLAHELAHYMVAFVLGANPRFPSLVPTRTPKGWQLGSVAIRAGHVRAVPIAMAPLLLLPVALWWSVLFLHHADGLLYAVHAWVCAALLTACMPSGADIKLALPALLSLALLIGVIMWLLR